MRKAIAATLIVVAALVAANMLGVAAAEAPTVTPLRTVSVAGVATVPIAQGANLATATSIYREGMADAMADGQNKAEFLVTKAGGTLGSVQSIVEGGGSIGCSGDEESGYVGYEGEEPDFGSPRVTVAPVAAPAVAKLHRPAGKRSQKRSTAKKASATKCALSAQVSLVYAIN